MKIQPPFHFDGHGINDTNGTRITKVSCLEPYEGNIRNEEFDALSELFAHSYEMKLALQGLLDSRAKNPNSKYGRMAREFARQVLDELKPSQV